MKIIMQKLLILLVWVYMGSVFSTKAQEIVARRKITLDGKLEFTAKNHFWINEMSKSKFYARIAQGNNIYDYEVDGEQTKTFSADVESDKHVKRVKMLETDAKKSFFVSVDENNVIKLWTKEGKLFTTIQEKVKVARMATNENKLAYMVISEKGASIKVYDYIGKKTINIKTDDLFDELKLSPDGKYLLGYKTPLVEAGRIMVWDLETRKPVFSETTNVQLANFTPDSKYFIYEAYKGLFKHSVDGKRVYVSEIKIEARNHSFSSDGKYIYANTFNQFLKIDIETGKIINQIEYKAGFLPKLLFSSDGAYALGVEESYTSNQVNLTVFKMDW